MKRFIFLLAVCIAVALIQTFIVDYFSVRVLASSVTGEMIYKVSLYMGGAITAFVVMESH